MSPQTAAQPPAWLAGSVPWLMAALVLLALGALVGIWIAAVRLRALGDLARRLEALEEIRHALARLVSDRGDLDLRRVEHVLLELRDGQKRLEDALLSRLQSPRPLDAREGAPGVGRADLGERVTNRLLALGYERIRLVTTPEDLERLGASGAEASGEVVVEARRGGALCKGRVLLRRGALTDVQIQPAYKLFP
jgi:hypothetical protein